MPLRKVGEDLWFKTSVNLMEISKHIHIYSAVNIPLFSVHTPFYLTVMLVQGPSHKILL